jgi:hypothetical protein
MTITNFKAILASYPDKNMRFVLPNGESIPANYHITEVGHVRKDFMDCGGTVRSAASCVLQAWVAENDEEHRLEAGKLGAILQRADQLMADANLPVEVEYESPVISQFSIGSSQVDSESIVFLLESKHTDCLAKESCGLEGGSGCSTDETSCCA